MPITPPTVLTRAVLKSFGMALYCALKSSIPTGTIIILITLIIFSIESLISLDARFLCLAWFTSFVE